MKPTYSCKCLKCGKIFNLTPNDVDEKPENRLTEEQIKKLGKDGCLNCQSKKLEWELPIYEKGERITFHYITDQCSKCPKLRIVDILNWEEIKEVMKRMEAPNASKTKQEMIEVMNKEDDKLCNCNDIRERERERERAKMGSIENPHGWLAEGLWFSQF